MKTFLVALSILLTTVSTAAFAAEKAILAGGCFWGTEEYFRKIPGVLETRVGYAGGTTKNPSYEQVSSGKTGHAESVEITFDPQKVSYETLLVHFFEMHDPTTANRQGNDRGTQYRSEIFATNDSQKKIAQDVLRKVDASHAWKAPLTTQIATAEAFYPAETYHQKYLVKNPGGYDNHFFRGLNFGSQLPTVLPPK